MIDPFYGIYMYLTHQEGIKSLQKLDLRTSDSPRFCKKMNLQLFSEKNIIFTAIFQQKLISALEFMYELSLYAFAGFNNTNYGLYCLRRVKDGKK